ncbi:hypothetical protein LP420_00880 [Massilia sp. B-10]|nr:hypothetical protein LP420_00880 [Massilia sp. B-10]
MVAANARSVSDTCCLSSALLGAGGAGLDGAQQQSCHCDKLNKTHQISSYQAKPLKDYSETGARLHFKWKWSIKNP